MPYDVSVLKSNIDNVKNELENIQVREFNIGKGLKWVRIKLNPGASYEWKPPSGEAYVVLAWFCDAIVTVNVRWDFNAEAVTFDTGTNRQLNANLVLFNDGSNYVAIFVDNASESQPQVFHMLVKKIDISEVSFEVKSA